MVGNVAKKVENSRFENKDKASFKSFCLSILEIASNFANCNSGALLNGCLEDYRKTFVVYGRPILEYCIPVWSQYFLSDIALLEINESPSLELFSLTSILAFIDSITLPGHRSSTRNLCDFVDINMTCYSDSRKCMVVLTVPLCAVFQRVSERKQHEYDSRLVGKTFTKIMS